MPHKTYKCSVCGEQVSKRKSYDDGNGGRACKIHKEVQAKADEKKKSQLKGLREQANPKKKKRRYDDPEIGVDGNGNLIPRCFCCNEEGLHQSDFHMRILVAMEKVNMMDDPPALFSKEYKEAIVELMKTPGVKSNYENNCLWIVSTKECPSIKKDIDKMLRDIIDHALVCTKCCKKHGHDPQEKTKTSEANLDDMMRLGDMYKEKLQDRLSDIAKKEIESENEGSS